MTRPSPMECLNVSTARGLFIQLPVRARNSVVAGHAAFWYSLMSPLQRVVLMTCSGSGGVPPARLSSASGGC